MAVVYILSLTDKELRSLQLKDVARAVQTGSIFLSKVFKNTLRISLAEFIKREKLNRAFYTLEKERNIRVKDLANRLGFPGLHHFEQEFENYFLIDPGSYKELVGKRKKQQNNHLPDCFCSPL